jgi:hypothetical protein
MPIIIQVTTMRVLVLISDEYRDRISEVTENLKAHGMTVDQVLDTVGVITGEINAEKLSLLQTVPGVSKAEEEGEPFEAL